MKVSKYILEKTGDESLRFVESPRRGGRLEPKFIVIHFTVGQSAEAAVAWLTRKSPGPSAHLVIGRDGSVTQMVPFDSIAFHTGPSKWNDLKGLDRYSIGIELDNAGPMIADQGIWKSKFGKAYPETEVIQAPHKHGGPYKAWHIYPEEQIEALIRVSQLLAHRYEIEDILGHDDISPGRKWDPGPAFPMGEVRKLVLGASSAKNEQDSNEGKNTGNETQKGGA